MQLSFAAISGKFPWESLLFQEITFNSNMLSPRWSVVHKDIRLKFVFI